ncbi:hypothetical protein HYX10_00730 [Candidatus Woesearchaeota archaeon]|nr:hypothetical protein [Candidatus Woesearchaeota archaeon]
MDDIKLVLVSGEGKHLHVRDVQHDYHCQYGIVKKGDLKSGIVKTNTGNTLFAFQPSFIDKYKKIRRAPQIIPSKDIGSIIAETGVNKESFVVDA